MTAPTEGFPEGQVQTDKDALELTDDPDLHILAHQMTFEKHLGQWGPVCRAAVHRPVCARYDPMQETGRTSCSGSEGQEGTNFQTPPRKGDVRPCFRPRDGWVFCSTDADTIELRAHAQNCLEMVGWSKMADALVEQHATGGADLHLRLGAALIGMSLDEAVAKKKEGDDEVVFARQFAKIPNFGFPGGLGAETLIAYAAGQRTARLALEVRCSEQVDRIATLSARSTDLLAQVSTLRRDLAAARTEALVASRRAQLQEEAHAVVLAEVDAVADAAGVRQSGGGATAVVVTGSVARGPAPRPRG